MKTGLVQYKFINNNISYNLSQIEKAMKASAGEADLICFGESFLQGFDALSWNYEKDKEIAIACHSEEIRQICRWSIDYHIAVLFGYFEKDNDRIYSSCALVNNGEVVCNYRRKSPGWKDSSQTDEHYWEGKEIKTFIFNDIEFEIALCGDLWDTDFEQFKTEFVVLWPVYVNFSLKEWMNEEKEYASQATLISDNVLMVNSLSEEPVSPGGTFFFKEGKIISRLAYDEENILMIEI